MDDVLLQLAAGSAGASSLAELGACTVEPMRRLSGAGHALLYAYDERGAMVGLSGDAWIPEVYRPYWAGDPTQAETKRLPPGPRVALADRLVGKQRLRRSRVYDEFYRPCELEHLACVFLTSVPHGAPGMTNLFLARGPKQEPYRERDVRLVSAALPILSAAVARLRRPIPPTEEELLVEWGRRQACLAMTSDGRIEWLSLAARALLGDSVPARIPSALVEQLRLATSAHWRISDGRLMRVDLLPSTVNGARALVLLAEASNSCSTTLSPAERNVMECLAAGNGTLEIAGILSLSEATVRTHLRNIYAKLRVHSRTEAVLAWHARANALDS